MAARTIINSGDTLVSLPREAALLATPGQRCPFPDWVDAAFWDSQPWWVQDLWLSKQTRASTDVGSHS